MRPQMDLRRWHRRPRVIAFLSFFFAAGLATNPSGSNVKGKAAKTTDTNNKAGAKALYIVLGIVAFLVVAVFFFKLWQKKKRAEQHARLLRLFEEDDELEVELDLRD